MNSSKKLFAQFTDTFFKTFKQTLIKQDPLIDQKQFDEWEKLIPLEIRSSYKLGEKLEYLRSIFPKYKEINKDADEKRALEYLYFQYIPLVSYIKLKFERLNKPLVLGIFGHQGTGKTTLSNALQIYLQSLYSYEVNTLSLDDIYKTYSDLEDLKKKEPEFQFRGPPGTHDIDLGMNVVNKFKASEKDYVIPRYDKSLNNGLGDRSEENAIKISKPLDILILEGWFLTVNPVTEEEIETYKKSEHSKGYFNENLIRKMNEKLGEYKELWSSIDLLLILAPEKYELSREFRINAEREMFKKTGSGMSEEQMNNFLDYFWNCIPPYLYFDAKNNMRPDIKITVNRDRNFLYDFI